MEGRNRSGGVVKNRGSSGCLIIKKKADGVTGAGSSKGRKPKNEKKRPRLNASESVSSDEEEVRAGFYRGRGGAEMNRVSGGGSVMYEDNDFDDMSFGRSRLMREAVPKGRELDIYDFDEYDDLSDIEMMRMRHYHGGGERMYMDAMPGLNNGGSGLDFDSGSSKGDIIYKRRNSFHGGSSSGKINARDVYSAKRRFEMRSELPVSMGKDKITGSEEAIRLQGKNGVLKVRVKHKEDIGEQFSQKNVYAKGNSLASRSQELVSKNVVARPSPFSERNVAKKVITVDTVDKQQQRKRKPAESSEESDEEAKDSGSSPKLQTDSVQANRSRKRGRSGGSTQSPQSAPPIKKEGKVKRGSGTEKQLLREKIRNMLLTAGWTIDYRPRRGRDYFDAVYVNPTGTAYWSIIKAYDALQKQLEEEGKSIKVGDECSSFAPISENVLSKLTRQTRKKMEKELKRKKREEAGGSRKKEFASGSFEEDESETDSGGSGRQDDKLSSFMKRSGKSLKKESGRDRSNSNSKMQRGEKSSSVTNSRFIHARKSKIGRCALLVRNPGKGLNSESDGFVPFTGKRNLLSWLIDSGSVKLSEKVHYMNRRCTRVMLEGWITREGIHCACCSKILTVSKFEIHAASKLRQPYQNIYLSSGTSLTQCLVDAWNRQEESLRNGFNKIDVNGEDPNDDTCAICCDGGNLICCDSCPSTFHQNCLGIEKLPPGDWHCPHCSCKFCGLADVSVTEENDKRQDTVLTCSFCEGKYHCSCVEGMDGSLINLNSPFFCGQTCQELSERFLKLLGVKHELEAGLFWSLIHRTDLDSDTSVRGYPQRVEWNSKLAVAQNVMDECFLPITDRRSGINMIHSVLYNSGSNIGRLDYSGFYTAVLEKGDEIISAASIRIRSTQFAEMPFIGTRHIYRRQGMCRRLFSAIESALRSLKVEKLIIPAISELMDTWTTVFGFSTPEESDKLDMKLGNMLVFPGTDILQKKLLDHDSSDRGLAGIDLFEKDLNAPVMPGLRKKSDLHSPPGLCSPAAEPGSEEMKAKPATGYGSENYGSIECSEEVKPSLPTQKEELKENSVTDFVSQEVGINEKSLHVASPDGCDGCGEVQPPLPTDSPCDSNGNKPSLHAAYADVSKEIKPQVFNEGILETTSSELQLDANEFGGDVKDNIFADPSAGTTTPFDSNDNKSSLHIASSDMPSKHASSAISNEVRPLVSNEGILETASSELQLSTKFDESAGDVKDHISAYAHSGTAISCDSDENKSSPLTGAATVPVLNEVKQLASDQQSLGSKTTEQQLDIMLNESIGDVKDHIVADAISDGSFLDGFAGRDYVGESADCKLGQGANVDFPEVGLPPVSGKLAATSVSGLSNGFVRSDNETQKDGIIYSEAETASHRIDHSSLDESHINVVLDKPMMESTVENNIHHPPDVQSNDASYVVPDETHICSESQSVHVSGNTDINAAHESKIYDSGNTVAHGKCHSLPETSHVDVAIEKPVIEPSAEGIICHTPEVQAVDADIASGVIDVFSGSKSLVSNGINQDTAHGSNVRGVENSATDGKDHSCLEASHVDVVTGKPMLEPPAEVNNCHPPEVQADGARIVSAKIDVCSGKESVHISNNIDLDAAHESKIHFIGNSAADGKDHSQLEASHVDVTEKPMVEPVEENICHPPKVQADDAQIVPAEIDVCSGSESVLLSSNIDLDAAQESKTCVFENSAADGKDHALSEASHVDVVMENHVIEPTAEDNVHHPLEVEANDTDIVLAETDVCTGSQSLLVSNNTDVDAADEPNIHASTNVMECSQIIEAMPVDDGACTSPQHAGHCTFSIEKPQLESYGGATEQVTSGGEVQNAEVASVQPMSHFSCEVSANTVDAKTHSSEDPPVSDSSIGVTGLLHVSELHDQGTM